MTCYNINIMNDEHFEIERKFLIRRPEQAYLEASGESTEILQTYLIGEPGETTRVRKRWKGDEVRYILTVKSRVSAMRQIEREREVSEAEYERLLEKADPDRKPVRKQRWVVDYHGQRFEIDLFPFWKKQAYLELELRDEDQKIEFPPALDVIREVTGDARYTNRALARAIPEEDE